jgi:hypothetical protein
MIQRSRATPLPTVTAARWAFTWVGEELTGPEGGNPTLVVEFADGRVAWIDSEQKPIYYGYDAVVLGDGHEGGMAFTGTFHSCWVMPGDPKHGREDHIFSGATTNKLIVDLAKSFWHAAREGEFQPRAIDLRRPPAVPRALIGAWFDLQIR